MKLKDFLKEETESLKYFLEKLDIALILDEEGWEHFLDELIRDFKVVKDDYDDPAEWLEEEIEQTINDAEVDLVMIYDMKKWHEIKNGMDFVEFLYKNGDYDKFENLEED